MFGAPKSPLDPRRYAKSPDSRPLALKEEIGRYVYVVDLHETIHVAPDGSHMHPRVLGGGMKALYAGEIAIDRPGSVEEITNNSGTFRFDDKNSLCCVVAHVRQIGFVVDKIRWSPPDGSTRTQPLDCP